MAWIKTQIEEIEKVVHCPATAKLDNTHKVYINKYVGWSKLEEGWVKLNTDEFSKGKLIN